MKFFRALIIFVLIPLIAGYFVASTQGAKKLTNNTNVNFDTSNVQVNDSITIAEKGNIISLTQKGVNTIQTNHPQLIEVVPSGANFVGVDKQTNYSDLDEFSQSGTLINTIQNGNTGDIDTMNWYTDPAISLNNKQLAFVSDKDKAQTNIQDNALFVANLATGTVGKIADPDPHSGGIAHPIWDPINPNIITYDYYQYDQSFNPYSIIEEYNIQTQNTVNLTTQNQNAYQGSFSPDGKQFIFLERNNNITTNMDIADVSANGLSNVRQIASGDFSYPTYSNTPGHIYYLQAQGNTGYDLYTATIVDNKLNDENPITTSAQLLGNSGFVVTKEAVPQQN